MDILEQYILSFEEEYIFALTCRPNENSFEKQVHHEREIRNGSRTFLSLLVFPFDHSYVNKNISSRKCGASFTNRSSGVVADSFDCRISHVKMLQMPWTDIFSRIDDVLEQSSENLPRTVYKYRRNVSLPHSRIQIRRRMEEGGKFEFLHSKRLFQTFLLHVLCIF